MKAGFDIGSKTIGYAVLDGGDIVAHGVVDHNGDIPGSLSALVDRLRASFGPDAIHSWGLTGSADHAGSDMVDPILAAVEANRFFDTGCRNIISIGCESFCLIVLNERGDYVEHAVNPMCASGTGSFLDQQAGRIGLSTEELAEQAFRFSGKTPGIATRCAVFAKSDIIHAQADGYSKDAIGAGLCEGMTRSVVAGLVRGRTLGQGVVFTGGVSANRKVAMELAEQLKQEVRILEHSQVFDAVGAALLGRARTLDPARMAGSMRASRDKRPPLVISLTEYPDFSSDDHEVQDGVEIWRYQHLDREAYSVFIGMDVGSTSTKALVLDEGGEILLGLYTRTAGDPVRASGTICKLIGQSFGGKDLRIRGMATTGSGRKLVKEVLGADMVVNEITAHATGALYLDPDVDTIIEIGGQDSKFTMLENGRVVNATMNYVCAAGTGSFIEEQASRLGVALDDIEALAEGRSAPYTSDRCTVYMERDLNTFLAEGHDRAEIITAVLHSVRDNYLSKVVGTLPLGERIFFQGATARNKSLVAAFEQKLNRPISVSRFCHLTGALGGAVLLMRQGLETSSFSGLDLSYTVRSESCELCHNRCELSVYTVGHRTTAWGLKCGRDYEDKKVRAVRKVSTLERAFREIMAAPGERPLGEDARTIGMPASLYLAEYGPLFQDMFARLGHKTVVRGGGKMTGKRGRDLANADFCAPMVAMHGAVAELLETDADLIFMPALINDRNPGDAPGQGPFFYSKERDNFFCYYSEYGPTIAAKHPALDLEGRMAAPLLYLDEESRSPHKDPARAVADSLEPFLPNSREEVEQAFINALHEHRLRQARWRGELDQTLKNARKDGKPMAMLLGRPYSIFDPQVSLAIPATLENMGFDLLYQSMIMASPEDCPAASGFLENMNWYYGRQILKAAEFAARTDGVYPVFLSCFRCSPDSYLLTYVKEIFNRYGKPYLVIQLDEHTSDVGYQTRLEAAADTFMADFNRGAAPRPKLAERKNPEPFAPGDTVLVPFLSDVFSRLYAESFRANGYEARSPRLSQEMINAGYAYASGGECMPNAAIIGSVLECVKRYELDPSRCTLYLPSLCLACNFNQYGILARQAFRTAGMEGLKVWNGNMLGSAPNIPARLNSAIVEVNILGSLLYKLYYRLAPYVRDRVEADQAFSWSMERIIQSLHSKETLLEAAGDIRARFEGLALKAEPRRPRVYLVGDIYAKYNGVLNQDVAGLIMEQGGEVILPSYTENASQILHHDVRENGLDDKYHRALRLFEKRYEKVFQGILDEVLEPDVAECEGLLREYGIHHAIAGETSVTVGRVLHGIKYGLLEAVVHVNPVFCCPGSVSASLLRKVQEDFGVPVVDLFYDGNSKPNKLIIPQLHYLKRNRERDTARI